MAEKDVLSTDEKRTFCCEENSELSQEVECEGEKMAHVLLIVWSVALSYWIQTTAQQKTSGSFSQITFLEWKSDRVLVLCCVVVSVQRVN